MFLIKLTIVIITIALIITSATSLENLVNDDDTCRDIFQIPGIASSKGQSVCNYDNNNCTSCCSYDTVCCDTNPCCNGTCCDGYCCDKNAGTCQQDSNGNYFCIPYGFLFCGDIMCGASCPIVDVIPPVCDITYACCPETSEICCPSDFPVCCSDHCCPSGTYCCGEGCCPDDSVFCGVNTYCDSTFSCNDDVCCPGDSAYCGAEVYCNNGQYCCGDTGCCPTGSQYCGSECNCYCNGDGSCCNTGSDWLCCDHGCWLGSSCWWASSQLEKNEEDDDDIPSVPVIFRRSKFDYKKNSIIKPDNPAGPQPRFPCSPQNPLEPPFTRFTKKIEPPKVADFYSLPLNNCLLDKTTSTDPCKGFPCFVDVTDCTAEMGYLQFFGYGILCQQESNAQLLDAAGMKWWICTQNCTTVATRNTMLGNMIPCCNSVDSYGMNTTNVNCMLNECDFCDMYQTNIFALDTMFKSDFENPYYVELLNFMAYCQSQAS